MAEQVTIQITENKTINVSDVLGNLKISTAAPTTQGLYMLSDIGTYTNLGGLVAEAGKVNYAYFDGSAWGLVSVDLLKPKKIYVKNIITDTSVNNGGKEAPNQIISPIGSNGNNSLISMFCEYYGIRFLFRNKNIRVTATYEIKNLQNSEFGIFTNVQGAVVSNVEKNYYTANGLNYVDFSFNAVIGDVDYFQIHGKFENITNITTEKSAKFVSLSFQSDELSDFEIDKIQQQYNNGYLYNIINVSKNYNENNNGFGISKFNSIYEAHESIKHSCELNQFLIKVSDGVYDEFSDLWGNDMNTTEYVGMINKNHVFFEGNVLSPEKCVLKFDGAKNIQDGQARFEDIFVKAIIHITSFDGISSSNVYNRHKKYSIRGFYFDVKNARYCIHPESSGHGYVTTTTISDCILDYKSRPALVYTGDWSKIGGSPLAMGVTDGEVVLVENLKIINNTISGAPVDPGKEALSFHTNQLNGNTNWIIPTVLNGVSFTVRNVDLGGMSINCYSINEQQHQNVVRLENVYNAHRIYTYYTGTATKSRIKVVDMGFDGSIESMP